MTQEQAQRLTVIVGDDQTWHHKPLHHEIVSRARDHGLAGASVFRGMEGYGLSKVVHTTRLLDMSDDLPIVVVLVDTPQRIEDFLPHLEEVVGDGLILLEDVAVVRLGAHRSG